MTNDEPEQPITAHKEGDASSESKASQETKPQGSLVHVDIKATATDVFGLGKAAKTSAGEAVARGLLPALGYVLLSGSEWMFGRRNARTAAERIVLDARANSQASLIKAQTQQKINALIVPDIGMTTADASRLIESESERLRSAAGERIIAAERRRQENIEAVIREAIELADEMSPSIEPREIPEDFAFRVTDAASKHSAPNVRSIFARLIASRVKPNAENISNPSLQLLESLDGPLALVFEKFIYKSYQYEYHPPFAHLPNDGYKKQLSMLKEIGIIVDKYVSSFEICGFYLYGAGVGSDGIKIPVPTLSVRGQEIADAVFDEKRFKKCLLEEKISSEELFKHISEIINYYYNIGVENVKLGVRSTSGNIDYFTIRKKMKIDIDVQPGAADLFILDTTQFDRRDFNIDHLTKAVLQDIITNFTIEIERR